MGFGPGAVSYMNGLRWTNTRHPRAYVKNVFQNTSIILEAEELTPLGQLSETIIASLRLTKGVELVRLKRRFGDSALDAFASKIAKLKASGLLEQHDEHIRLTTKGVRWANDVMLEFLP